MSTTYAEKRIYNGKSFHSLFLWPIECLIAIPFASSVRPAREHGMNLNFAFNRIRMWTKPENHYSFGFVLWVLVSAAVSSRINGTRCANTAGNSNAKATTFNLPKLSHKCAASLIAAWYCQAFFKTRTATCSPGQFYCYLIVFELCWVLLTSAPLAHNISQNSFIFSKSHL